MSDGAATPPIYTVPRMAAWLFNGLHRKKTALIVSGDTSPNHGQTIRALGVPAPGSYAQFSERTSIDEENCTPPADEMIAQLVRDLETVVRTARRAFPLANHASDGPTADLLTQRMQIHEKTSWTLRSMIN